MKAETFRIEASGGATQAAGGTCRFHLGACYVSNRTLFRLIQVDADNLRPPTGKTCPIPLSDGRLIEVVLVNEAEAESFHESLLAKLRKRLRTGEEEHLPKSVAEDSLESVPSPVQDVRPMSNRRLAPSEDIMGAFTRNCLPAVGGRMEVSRSSYDTTPKPSMQRSDRSPVKTSHHFDNSTASPTEETLRRKRAIEARVWDMGGATPEKHFRSYYAPRRAPSTKAPLLTVYPSLATTSPQKSSQYQQYRYQETFGLRNLGNTCYLNAVMQALHSLSEFVASLKTLPQRFPNAADGDLFRCTIDILGQMSSPAALNGPLSPAKLRERIASVSPAFRGNGQQDAHEFFLEYVNQLHDELYAARNDSVTNGTAAVEAMTLTTQQFFDSQVHKCLSCMECDVSREVHELFRDFSLDMTGIASESGPCSLSAMLKAYFAPEDLELKCEKCPCSHARMESALASPPKVLVLHLKRFVPNFAQNRYDKFHQHVDFPQVLDLFATLQGSDAGGTARGVEQVAALRSPDGRLPARPLAAAEASPVNVETPPLQPRQDGTCKRLPPLPPPAEAPPQEPVNSVVEPAAQLVYDLRSVVSHEGSSPHSGHYVCYAKRSGSSVWTCFNDALVEDLPHMKDPQSQLGRKAYMLFYVQR